MKKHLKLLAKVFNHTYLFLKDKNKDDAVLLYTINKMTEEFKKEYPDFNPVKFKKACFKN